MRTPSIHTFLGISTGLKTIEETGIVWVVVRENSEGEYAGHGGRSHRGTPHEVATDVVRRVMVSDVRTTDFGGQANTRGVGYKCKDAGRNAQ